GAGQDRHDRRGMKHVAELTLELQNLSEHYVPRAHTHAPLPVALRGRVDALAPRHPNVEEERRLSGARDDAERDFVARRALGPEAPHVRLQPRAGDERRDEVALVV